jgi:hypothetical protein
MSHHEALESWEGIETGYLTNDKEALSTSELDLNGVRFGNVSCILRLENLVLGCAQVSGLAWRRIEWFLQTRDRGSI